MNTSKLISLLLIGSLATVGLTNAQGSFQQPGRPSLDAVTEGDTQKAPQNRHPRSHGGSNESRMLQHLIEMDDAQLAKLRQTIEHIEKMSPEEKANMRERLKKMNKMDPGKVDEMRKRYKEIPQDEREAMRKRWMDTSPEEREAMRARWSELSEEERKEWRDKLRQMSPEERKKPSRNRASYLHLPR